MRNGIEFISLPYYVMLAKTFTFSFDQESEVNKMLQKMATYANFPAYDIISEEFPDLLQNNN